jgi:PPK2 family polyphosphate:nucleotide phosphotransferase
MKRGAGARGISLLPLAPGRRPRLGDKHAHRPAQLSDGEELERALRHELARLEGLQAALYAEGTRSLLIVLQGRDASGKDGVVRHVAGEFNPQGVEITSFKRPTDIELRHDYLWRVHKAVPPAGMIGVFNRSHYEDVIVTRVHGAITRKDCVRRCREINDFERMLVGNRMTILKFFLHVSRAEQGRRLDERLADPKKNWKFQEGDLSERALWDEYTRAYAEALSQSSTSWAPWYLVPADNKSARNLLIARTIADTLTAMAPRFPRADRAVILAAQRLRRG